MLPPIKTTLSLSSAVTALVASRIYRHGEAPQNVAKPYITWFLVAGTPENQLSGTPPADRQAVQVDGWSEIDQQTEQLAIAIRDALESYAHMTATVVNGRDPETKLYRIGSQFDWWLSR